MPVTCFDDAQKCAIATDSHHMTLKDLAFHYKTSTRTIGRVLDEKGLYAVGSKKWREAQAALQQKFEFPEVHITGKLQPDGSVDLVDSTPEYIEINEFLDLCESWLNIHKPQPVLIRPQSYSDWRKLSQGSQQKPEGFFSRVKKALTFPALAFFMFSVDANQQ